VKTCVPGHDPICRCATRVQPSSSLHLLLPSSTQTIFFETLRPLAHGTYIRYLHSASPFTTTIVVSLYPMPFVLPIHLISNRQSLTLNFFRMELYQPCSFIDSHPKTPLSILISLSFPPFSYEPRDPLEMQSESRESVEKDICI